MTQQRADGAFDAKQRGFPQYCSHSPTHVGRVSPDLSPYLPTGHRSVQFGDVSRLEVPYVPLGQEMQEPDPAGAYVPALQGVPKGLVLPLLHA